MDKDRIGSDRTARRRNRPEVRWAGLGKLGLAGLGLGLRKKERTGPRPVSQRAAGIGGSGGDGWGRRFSPLDAATTAREGSDDGSGHRRRLAVVDLGLTGV
ncbi:hypothetical protein CRG98_015830 [Punica granatum]|uniref:Uncharacterized protein n=1 Tax=Punica granatum TaxID=22663 RepID=A0A2I0K823_PUNGR|nr:hypothetical protein CRG98_015830 [Punica granatum]